MSDELQSSLREVNVVSTLKHPSEPEDDNENKELSSNKHRETDSEFSPPTSLPDSTETNDPKEIVPSVNPIQSS